MQYKEEIEAKQKSIQKAAEDLKKRQKTTEYYEKAKQTEKDYYEQK